MQAGNQKWLWGLFLLMATAQIFVATQMIFKHEKTLQEGKLFKFKTAPIDPSDPFRGKYITLNFDARSWTTVDSGWVSRQRCFVLLEEDDVGFAKIADVQKNPPEENAHFVQAKVSVLSTMKDSSQIVNELMIEYPFEQFFMEEGKAPVAESKFFEIARDTTKIAYALVSVNKGSAVIKDVFIGNQSVRDLAARPSR